MNIPNKSKGISESYQVSFEKSKQTFGIFTKNDNEDGEAKDNNETMDDDVFEEVKEIEYHFVKFSNIKVKNS
jgi:hypothetical protein